MKMKQKKCKPLESKKIMRLPNFLFFLVSLLSVVLVSMSADVNAQTSSPVIGFTTKKMQTNNAQTLTASGGQEPYTWHIIRGGGSLSSSTGPSITYTAPSSNPSCAYNPKIWVTDAAGNQDSVELAVNAYTRKQWNDIAYLESACTTYDNCYPDICQGYGGGFSYGTAARLQAYFCDGTPNNKVSSIGTRGCNSCFTSCCGKSCNDGICPSPSQCDTCAGRFAIGDAECQEFTDADQLKDKRTPDMIIQGCCTEPFSTCLSIGSLKASPNQVNISAGQSILISGQITPPQAAEINWTLDMPDTVGTIAAGTGPSVSVNWDGKYASGKFVEPGGYMARLIVRNSDGSCSDMKSIPVTVTATPDQCLISASIGSSLNVTQGSLSHSQTLFSVPNSKFPGDFELSYSSSDARRAPLGTGWTHTYNIKLKQNTNNTYTFTKGSGTRILLSSNGARYTPSKDSYPALTANADGTFTVEQRDGIFYQFDTSQLLIGISDRNGNTTILSYEQSGKLTGVIDPSGRNIVFSYNADLISSIIDTVGNTHSFTYTNGHLTGISSTIPELGISNWIYTYDNDGYLLTKTDPNAKTTTYVYDNSHKLASSIDPEGKTRTITYSPELWITRITEKDGGVWTYKYDPSNGVLMEKSDPLGNTTRYTYDAIYRWKIAKVADPKGYKTTYTYDANGNTATVTDAANKITRYTYNNMNKPTKIEYPEAAVIDATYDIYGNLTSITDPLRNTTQYTYDSKGNLVSVLDALGRTTTFVYDANSYLVSETDPTGSVTRFSYDAVGNVLSLQDPLNNVTTFEYNSLHKIKRKIDPLNAATTYTYDGLGNLLTITDANQKTTQYSYNYDNRVISIIDANGNATNFTYGSSCPSCGGGVDKLTAITDPKGNQTTFEYDLAGRLLKETNPLGYFKTYTYDAAGARLTRTDENGHTTEYLYDSLYRLTRITYHTSPATYTYYDYSARGKVISARNPNVNYTLTYNLNDILTGITRSDGKNVTYQPNAMNLRTQMTTPDGRTITYGYDAADRLTQITSAGNVFNLGYDNASRRTGVLNPNGSTISNTFDPAGRLISILAKDQQQTTIDSSVYTFDASGYRTSKVDPLGTHAYTYDPTYRLITASHPDAQIESYGYDPAGNRSNATVNTNNRLIEDSDNTYNYDNNGNLVQKISKANGATTSYAYDYENRLTQVTAPGMSVQYKYDALSRRIEKKVNTTYSRYVYDGPNIVTEYSTSWTLKAAYIHTLSIDDPLAVAQGGNTYYYLKDALGSITGLADSTGNVVRTYRYDAYGSMYGGMGTLSQPYAFTGREYDSEIGLYYYRARYYDPKTGRFLTQDPIGFAGGDVNLYGYVLNNPVNFVDPYGLWRSPSKIYDEALENAQSKFPRSELHNGLGDAYRHCLASCMMSREDGSTVSSLLGWANEVRGNWTHNQESGERKMDDHNNAYGRQCAAGSKDTGDCQQKCIEAVNNGDLKTYDSGSTPGYWH